MECSCAVVDAPEVDEEDLDCSLSDSYDTVMSPPSAFSSSSSSPSQPPSDSSSTSPPRLGPEEGVQWGNWGSNSNGRPSMA
jgi:hypothetical protein